MSTNNLSVVLGLGQTGLSVVAYLASEGEPCVVFDEAQMPPYLSEIKAKFPQIPVHLGPFKQTSVENIKQIIVSPGIDLNNPWIEKAQAQGIPVLGDIELFARINHVPLVGITGTNGKSTVTALLGAMAERSGIRVAVCGNIGKPVLDCLHPKPDLYVIELSSFQLDTTKKLPLKAATVLNLSEDHLNRYPNYAAYIASKQKIYDNCTWPVVYKEDPNTYPKDGRACTSFSQFEPEATEWGLRLQAGKTYLAQGAHCVLSVALLKMVGRHNWLNALAALALGEALGFELKVMLEALQDFEGLPHRCRFVREVDGVRWYNDSKGTNVGATIAAIKGLGGTMLGKIVLIAGGQSKGAHFEDLKEPVGEYVRTVVLMGEDAGKIADALVDLVPVLYADSLEEAVLVAKRAACPGDVVLMSPACASFDMFSNFKHRGEVFTERVEGL